MLNQKVMFIMYLYSGDARCVTLKLEK